MDTPTVGLRERKKQRTVEAVTRIATEMFIERGFDGVTVDDIAAAAEISPRTFYRYFGSKEEVVLGDVNEGIARFTAAFRARPDTETVGESIRAVVGEIARGYECAEDTIAGRQVIESTPLLQLRISERQSVLEGALAPLIAERLGVDVATDVRPRLHAACALAAVRIANEQWLAAGARGSLIDAVQAALVLVADGFDGPATSAMAKKTRKR